MFIKIPFKRNVSHYYYAFSATEIQKIMVNGILGRELDFEQMLTTGVIVDHFPLHKRT